MLNSQIKSESEINELNRTIDDYRAKLDEIAQKEKERLRQLYEKEAVIIINGAWQKAEEIIAQSQQEAKISREKMQNQAEKEISEIIASARQKAQQIIAEAEARDRKEAKNRTKSEVEKIIVRTKEESESIIASARIMAEKEAKEIVSRSREEAERLVKEEISKCRVDAQAQLIHAVAEAHTRAKSMIDGIAASNTEISESILKVMQETENIANAFKSGLQMELGELTRIIALARQKAEQVTTEAVESGITLTALTDANKKTVLPAQLWGDKPGGDTISALFSKGR